jgi:hypothetical protein
MVNSLMNFFFLPESKTLILGMGKPEPVLPGRYQLKDFSEDEIIKRLFNVVSKFLKI